MVYRAKVTKVLDDGVVYVEISGLGIGGEFGPLPTGDLNLIRGDRVVVDSVAGVREELVYLGRVTPVPDAPAYNDTLIKERITALEVQAHPPYDHTTILNRLTSLEGFNVGSRLTTLEGQNAGTRLTTLEGQNAGTRLTALETSDSTQSGKITALESNRVLKAGDTMTGPLVLPGDPTTSLQAVTKNYVDVTSRVIADIPDAVDLNTYITRGSYIQSFNTRAISGSNYPVPLAGLLEVFNNAAGTHVWQRYTVYNSGTLDAGKIWTRQQYNNGAWSTWVVANCDDWKPIPFEADWANYGSVYEDGEYRYEDDALVLRGLVKTNIARSGSAIPIAKFPSFTPPKTRMFTCQSSVVGITGAVSTGTAHTHVMPAQGTTMRVDVNAAGDVMTMMVSGWSLAVGGWVSLENVKWTRT